MKLLEVREKFSSDQEFINAVDEQLKKLMTENPHFIYTKGGETCSYNTGPDSNKELCSGCIFGQALQALGWHDECQLSSKLNIGGILERFVDIRFRDKTPKYWFRIQELQDSGSNWGKLLECFNG